MMPVASAAWKAPALRDAGGHAFSFDGCGFHDGPASESRPRVATRVLTNDALASDALGVKCSQTHVHTASGSDGTCFPELQDLTLAQLLAPPCASAVDDAMPIEESAPRLHELREQFGHSVLRYVGELHQNMGHPSPGVLSRMLSGSGAATSVVQGASRS